MISRFIPLLLLFAAGAAALSWQVLWQMDLALALGVSAKGAALTIATAMAGMTAGALWAGRKWERGTGGDPWRVYAMIELGIGVSAWLPRVCMPAIERADTAVFQSAASFASPFLILALAVTLGPASFLMGASLPVMGLIAQQAGTSPSRLYAANTIGAACGTLLVAQLLLPSLGRAGSGGVVFAIDLLVAGAAFALSLRTGKKRPPMESATLAGAGKTAQLGMPQSLIFCACTGFVTFVLEVAWFRLLRAAWLSTSDSFAIMLFCFLVGIGAGAWLSKRVRDIRASLPMILCMAALAIWLGTAIIERFDLWADAGGDYDVRIAWRIVAALLAMGPAIALLGISLPALLDSRDSPRQWAWLYAVNTLGAVVGSLLAGWWLMGWLGPVKTSWVAGLLLVAVAVPAIPTRTWRIPLLIVAALGAAVAWVADSGIGATRVQGPTDFVRREHRVLAHQNGPDVTTSVVRTREGFTLLFIDGYAATGEVGGSSAYMDAMGRLPMMLHPAPEEVLVICFGTGQTVRAALDENPKRVTVVDVNAAAYQFAGQFPSNRGVLRDVRVQPWVMDGRAWLRRSQVAYDVVTLEPMPPFFAGSNSLYSVEFYTLIHNRLREGGYVAQWFPIHLLTPSQARAVAATFLQVFPQAVLWFDRENRDAMGIPQQGILIGHKAAPQSGAWPGFTRDAPRPRRYTQEAVSQGIILTTAELTQYVKGFTPITDNNQRLSFGSDGLHHRDLGKGSVTIENMAIIRKFSAALK